MDNVMKIDHYSFGRIVINGQEYAQDVIIFPDRVECPWRRERGHDLAPEDLAGVIAACPDMVIIGTGSSGMMRVPNSMFAVLEEMGIVVRAVKTATAVDMFNSASGKEALAAALHLTC